MLFGVSQHYTWETRGCGRIVFVAQILIRFDV